MKLLNQITHLLVITLILASCGDDDNVVIIEPDPSLGDYENGILITNEGPFGAGTGTVSFISEDFATINNNIYNGVNSSDLGNIVQSMGFTENSAYIVVNNSHKIEVVNRYTFESVATIEDGLNNPRYFTAVGTKGYVTNWGDPTDESDDFIAVIDLETNLVVTTISVSYGPEKIVSKGASVYVAHKGGYGQNNIISVLDATNNNASVLSITVGDVPNSMLISRENLWVLCEGNPEFTGDETNGRLVKIDTGTNSVVQAFDFALTDHPNNLTLDGQNLIYSLNGSVFSKDENSTALPTESVINGFFYAMAANEGKLYATDAGDFTSNGTLKVFDLSTNSEIQSIEVGIIPGGVYFNN